MPGNLCEHCTAVCCKYIALPIETPSTRKEFDELRWYLIHQGISIFVEDGDWYLCVQTACRHLQSDSRCGIYETRPQICRDYSNDNCDYHSGDYGWEQHFTAAEHLDEYLKSHKPGRRPKRKTAGGRKRSGVKATRRRRVAPLAPPTLAAATTDRFGVALPILGLD